MNPVLDIANAVTGIVEKYFPSKLDKEKVQLMAQEIAQHAQEISQKLPLAQVGVDEIEAQSPKVFIAGARPFVEWICGLSLASTWLVWPTITVFAKLIGHPIDPPLMDTTEQIAILCALFGIHVLKSVGKPKGL